MQKKLTLVLGFILSLLLIPQFCLAQGVNNLPSFISSPQQLSQWFLKEFKYVGEMPDYWQSAEETMNLRQGDCEDFAILAQAILGRLGINSQIAIVKFKGLNQSHAICIWQENGFYNFISNQTLIQTKAGSVKEAIEEKYPDWEQITFTSPKGEHLKVVKRDKSPASYPQTVYPALK